MLRLRDSAEAFEADVKLVLRFARPRREPGWLERPQAGWRGLVDAENLDSLEARGFCRSG